MWWAGVVATDVTTSGCVASVEAAPPTDALNFIFMRHLGAELRLTISRPTFCGGTVYGYRGRSSAPACALSFRKFVCWVCAPFGQCPRDAARGGVRSRNPKHNVHMPSSQHHVVYSVVMVLSCIAFIRSICFSEKDTHLSSQCVCVCVCGAEPPTTCIAYTCTVHSAVTCSSLLAQGKESPQLHLFTLAFAW